MKSVFCGMSQKSSNLNPDADPLREEGIPAAVYQRMFGDCNTVKITVDLLTLLLAPLQDHGGNPVSGARLALPADLITEGLFSSSSERLDSSRTDPRSDLHTAILLGFRFLKQVVKECSINASKLAESQGFLAVQLGGPFKVVDTYGELFRSEPRLLNFVTDANVLEIVMCLKETQQRHGEGARFVDLLLTLCSSGGIPFPANQVRIVELFLKTEFQWLCKMRLGGLGPEFQFQDKKWLPLKNMKETNGVLPCMLMAIGDCTPDEKMFR